MAPPIFLFSISFFSSVLSQIILCSASEREMFYAALLYEESLTGYGKDDQDIEFLEFCFKKSFET
jgi:predicted glycosyltransferase involved in capsule biosynthesis